MNIQDFLAILLPEGDCFFATAVKSNGKPMQSAVTDIDELAAKVLRMDRAGHNAYFALASFNGEDGGRKQTNVAKLKCFWLDLDCKGKNDGSDYPDKKAAITDLKRFCDAVSLPMPTVVDSGYGVHAYWVLDESIDEKQWKTVAKQLRKTLDAYGVRHDSSCTTDSARILRPIGTHNKKDGKPDAEVKLLGTVRDPIGLHEFMSKLGAPIPMPTFPIHDVDMSLNEAAEAAVEFRPSSIKEIVKECALLREIGRVGGNVSEPLWHKTLGLVKHTIEGDKAIHAFSKGHPDYCPDETEAKAEAWGAGPSTCDVLHRECPPELKVHCAKCKYNGTITSPIVLGYPKVMMVETMTAIVENKIVEIVVEVPSLPVSMQHSFKWEDDKLWRRTLDKEASKESEEKVFMWVPFCEFYFFPFSYYDDEEKRHRMVWRLREREGVYREFTLSGGAMGAGGQFLFKELGEQSVTAMINGKPHMEAYIATFMADVKRKAPSTKTYTNFGWNGEDFLIGNTLIKEGGETSKVRVGGAADKLMHKGYFEPSGDTERWAELVDKLYNYEGQEQFQFVLATGFGSPLMRLMDCDGGTVISAVSRGSGLGKSTAGKLATGMYGDGRSGRLTLTLEQASPKAVHAYAGLLNGIPIMLDEMTNVDPAAASTVVYTHSQGSGRVVCANDGSLNLGRHHWSSLMNISANTPIAGLIQSAKPGAEAEQARMIEFTVEDVSKIPKDEADAMLKELFNIKTVVGVKFMTWVQANRPETIRRLEKVQAMVDKRLNLQKRDRYWSYAIAAVITGAMIAKELGLIGFDISAILRWLEVKVLDIRKEIENNTSTPVQLFSSMLTALAPGILVTDIEGDRRSNTTPTIIREPRPPYTGRLIVDEKRLWLPQPMVNKWCAEHQVAAKELISEMAKIGWVLFRGEPAIKYPSKGTHITMGQFRCYTVDTSKLGTSEETAPEFENVVALFKKAEGK